MNKGKAFKVEAIVNSKPSRSVPKGNFSRLNILKQYDDYKKAINERQPENKNQLLENLKGLKSIHNQIEENYKNLAEIQRKRKSIENEIKSGAKTLENKALLFLSQ